MIGGVTIQAPTSIPPVATIDEAGYAGGLYFLDWQEALVSRSSISMSS